ncbi:MAG: hypothetical protein EOO56_24715, partial [Hymenobacter sp.]
MRRHEITDRQWEAVSPLLSGKATDCGVTAKDNRLFFNAVVWNYCFSGGAPAEVMERWAADARQKLFAGGYFYGSGPRAAGSGQRGGRSLGSGWARATDRRPDGGLAGSSHRGGGRGPAGRQYQSGLGRSSALRLGS